MTLNTILLATGNQGKIKEITNQLQGLKTDFVSRKQFTQLNDPVENGHSFYENALIKAKYYFENTGLPALADDSGLVVESLNGDPGIYSARYAGENATDIQNNEKLLNALKGVTNRTAYFRCCMVFYYQDNVLTAEGEVRGRIIDTPAGNNGFGYDPIFYLDNLKKTMAECTTEEKNSLSHRARALENLYQQLKEKY